MLLTASIAALAILACRDIAGLRPPEFSSRYLNPSGIVIVSPSSMHGWGFYDDQNGVACGDTLSCRLVQGPGTPPAGNGSAELAVDATSGGNALVLQDYAGTRLSEITELRYSTYRQSADAGNNLAIALQLNVDYDLTDQATGYQGRIVFEPYQGTGGNVLQGTWQTWDARAGKWWGTGVSVPRGGVTSGNPCVQATPCSWAELLAAFPNVGVHATYGAVVLKAGSGWASFRGNVDKLAIGVNGETTTFDFELGTPARVGMSPPDTFSQSQLDSLGTVSGAPLPDGIYRRDIVLIRFEAGTSIADRQAAIDSVNGTVVGGHILTGTKDGTYYVRVHGGTAASLFHSLLVLQRQPGVLLATWWSLIDKVESSYRKPIDAQGAWSEWHVDPTGPESARQNWALEYARAPMAWGCSVGSSQTRVAVVDLGVDVTENIRANVDSLNSSIVRDSVSGNHGSRVASILAAVGNDGRGMTGMAWHARLILRDQLGSIKTPGTRPFPEAEPAIDRETEHLVRAGLAGASVINVSWGLNWYLRREKPFFDPSDSLDVMKVNSMRNGIVSAIQTLAAQEQPLHPLFVIAAGNDASLAYVQGTAAAKEVYPQQILVAGALGIDGKPWPQSNHGALVDVYAPGVRVTQADVSDQLVQDEPGTSFAAPLVSGTAVLLKDFDPSLSAADLVRLIKAGARTEDGVLKLDAYGALQQAAREPGAPLCGNRVYKSGNGIYAQRTAGAEKIIDLPNQTADSGNANLDVYHGGKRIDVGFTEEYDWRASPRGFAHAAAYEYSDSLIDGAAYLSAIGISHDYDVRARSSGPFQYLMNEPVATDSATLSLYGSGISSSPITIDRFTISRPTTQSVVGRVPVPKPDDHFAGYFADANWTYVGEWTQPSGDPVVAMAPDGTFALAAVNFVTVGLTANQDFVDCAPPGLYDMPPAQCASGTHSWSSDHAEIYRVDVAARTVRHLASIPSTSIAWMAFSENERELVWQTVTNRSRIDVRYYFQADQVSYGMNYSSILSGDESCTGKKFEYRAFDPTAEASAQLGASPILTEAVDDGCFVDHSNLGGTIAPSRVPRIAGGVQLQPSASAVQKSPAWRRAARRMEARRSDRR